MHVFICTHTHIYVMLKNIHIFSQKYSNNSPGFSSIFHQHPSKPFLSIKPELGKVCLVGQCLLATFWLSQHKICVSVSGSDIFAVFPNESPCRTPATSQWILDDVLVQKTKSFFSMAHFIYSIRRSEFRTIFLYNVGIHSFRILESWLNWILCS